MFVDGRCERKDEDMILKKIFSKKKLKFKHSAKFRHDIHNPFRYKKKIIIIKTFFFIYILLIAWLRLFVCCSFLFCCFAGLFKSILPSIKGWNNRMEKRKLSRADILRYARDIDRETRRVQPLGERLASKSRVAISPSFGCHGTLSTNDIIFFFFLLLSSLCYFLTCPSYSSFVYYRRFFSLQSSACKVRSFYERARCHKNVYVDSTVEEMAPARARSAGKKKEMRREKLQENRTTRK